MGRGHVGAGAFGFGRRLLARCIVERRVHDDRIGRIGAQARIRECRSRRADIERHRPRARGKLVAADILVSKRRKRRVAFDKDDGRSLKPGCHRKARRADASAEIDDAPGPPHRGCQQDGVVAKAMPAPRLQQP
jgi:hypothetical protein